ncbi:Tc toxin subunit A-related protein [Serratia liquefaciens]|uniref:Uncharacterized protein n=1 Tax=Serratia liquefaciens TaxID=614 RepID=A0A515D5M0_SERLI|nr:neuraminidase-like domain-containing protein [Serratia liquefaciens]QDL35696.1 hypothetical protein EGO53_28285 [Serratia liquefaciens]
MYSTADILKKLNTPASEVSRYSGEPQQPTTLADIMMLSFPEVRSLSGERITREEQCYLWEQAQLEEKANRMLDSRLLSRANPQLAHAVRMGIGQSSSFYSFDTMFGGRAEHFVKPGAVSSMFSPAAYLAQLYYEANKLYEENSPHHLNSRRPDLQSLKLSQENLDGEISTLKVCNEVLKQAINKSGTDVSNVYNPNFDRVRFAVQLQDPGFSAFRSRRNSARQLGTDTGLLSSLEANISSELIDFLIKNNDRASERLDAFCQATGLPVSDLIKVTGKPDATDKLTVSESTFNQLFQICGYIHRYHMSFSDAQTLVSAPLKPFTDPGVASVLMRVLQLNADDLLWVIKIISGRRKLEWPADPVAVDFLSQLVQWLEVKNLRPVDLFMMLTVNYSGENSPFDGKNSPKNRDLLTTLRHGLSGTHSEVSKSTLTDAAAPLVAAVYNLDSPQKGAALLQWLDRLWGVEGKKEGVQKLLQSLLNAAEKYNDDGITDEQVIFCQQLGQLALITQILQLTTAELTFAVEHPDKLSAKMTTLPHDLETILSLDSLHHGLQRCGPQGSDILSALKNGTLTAHQLSLVTGISQELMEGVLPIGEKLTWEDVDLALQWTDRATRLGVSCRSVEQLLALPYHDNTTTAWQAVADLLVDALPPQKATQLEAAIDETRSTALSNYAITHFTQIWKPKAEDAISVKDRNGLFNWLLLDNQVSAQVKTTQIGEAIASIQLYISQALAGQYGNVNAAVLSRPFLTGWDRYNKDYSSWAGLAQLVYYPENYLDPTLRIGQSGMMDEILQTLSQGLLNEDVVESAFKTYLTRFEEIANLNVINAYHDSLDEKSGKTYLLSRSAAGQYYWRSADVSKMKDGRLPANAWSEWKKIDIGIVATGDLIRPVIFQDRLYLFWLESQHYRASKIEGKSGSQNKQDILEYTLKYAHIKHDGSWTAPINIKIDKQASESIELITLLKNSADNAGIFCARHIEDDMVYICLYQKDESTQLVTVGVTQTGDFVTFDNKTSKLKDAIDIQLKNGVNAKKVNTLFHDRDFFVFHNNQQVMRYGAADIGLYGSLFEEHFNRPGVVVKVHDDEIVVRVDFELAWDTDLFQGAKWARFNGHDMQIITSKLTRINLGEKSIYSIKEAKFKFRPEEIIKHPDAGIEFTQTFAREKESEGWSTSDFIRIHINLTSKSSQNIPNICLHNDPQSGVQTLQYGDNPLIRINTLFAKQLISLANKGLSSILSMEAQTSLNFEEPDIFNSANALYYWEMFYYIPMMVFHRLLQESRFTEATQWIKYIWCPEGYIVDGEPAPWHWNVKPLEDNTDWNASSLDSVDPDAVAQADPMHYKVATFMSYLDLLIARGDAAYRRLERDTLNEAKMWYVQAMELLGKEPSEPETKLWNNPTLGEAGGDRQYVEAQQYLLAVRLQAGGEEGAAPQGTILAPPLFLPQHNEKLQGYWVTLRQRLYNLRHNLSIDGQPLSLPVYASPADPQALLTAAVNASSQSSPLPGISEKPVYRFPVILDSAKNITSQLIQFGGSMLSLMQQQDAEKLSLMLQNQGAELMEQSILIQQKTTEETQHDIDAIDRSIESAQSRKDTYQSMIDENISQAETTALRLSGGSTALNGTAGIAFTAAGVLDMAPNIFGLADGGDEWGAAIRAGGYVAELGAIGMRVTADTMFQNELYRRRRQEWEIQRNTADHEVSQLKLQKQALEKRQAATRGQLNYLTTQQRQIRMQMAFLQNKFTSQALYGWLRGKLASVYYQFYDLTVSRCLMAQKAYEWSMGTNSANFIRPGAWQDNHAGLMAGETLMLNLTQMEQRYLQESERQKEVVRTVCLSRVYAGLSSGGFSLTDKVAELITDATKNSGTDGNGLRISDGQMQATLKLSDLKIGDDYPSSLGNIRRIKQISVTLPALIGPYQDVRAVLSYSNGLAMPRGCDALAVSHGMNDSGQFQLDFNDSRWLPFEGIPVDDSGTLTLSFPQANSSQKDLLLSLTDIILHIRYTIAH